MDTDYVDYIKDYNESDTSSLKMLLKKKLADEIAQVQSVAGPDLENFLEMTRHKYMIDNVINIIEGTKNKTATAIIKSRSEPLGFLPEIEGLLNLDVKKIDELYEDVLIDTEVGYYFSKFLEEVLMSSNVKDVSTVNNFLQDLKPEKIKNYLTKIWFEYFYHYCETLNPTTREIMEDLLKFEADCQAIQIVYNSLAYDFNQFQEEERRKVIPFFGYLYPDITSQIIKASTFEQLKEACIELKKVNVLCIGLIEGIALGILNIFLFSWTPILKQSTEGGINVGFIYTCMVLTMIVGTKSYEVLIVYCNFDYYMSITGCLFVQGLLLYITYFDNRFLARLIYLSLFNGFTGFYNPLNSIVKSNILVEQYRALLMNLFRIPLNAYVIIVLLTLRYMNPFTVALIAGSLAFVAFGIGVFLVIYTYIHPEDNKPNEVFILDSIKKSKSNIYTGDDEEDNANDNYNDNVKPKPLIYTGEDDENN